MRPGIGRIRDGVRLRGASAARRCWASRGTVIITHGRAKRRMIAHAVGVGATTARERVPERIAEALAADAATPADASAAAAAARRRRWPRPSGPHRPRPGRRTRGLMARSPSARASSARWSGSPRSRSRASCASAAAARLARRARRLAGPGPRPRRRVHVTVWLVARPGQPLVPLTAQVRAAVGAAVERLLGLELAASRSWSMASGPDEPRRDATAAARTTSGAAAPGRRLALAAVFEAEFGQRTADAILERHLADGGRPGRPRSSPASSSRPWSATATVDARITARGPPISGRPAGPDGPRAAPLRPVVRCYTRPRRRPGWRSPSGSSWHGPTVAIRCAGS